MSLGRIQEGLADKSIALRGSVAREHKGTMTQVERAVMEAHENISAMFSALFGAEHSLPKQAPFLDSYRLLAKAFLQAKKFGVTAGQEDFLVFEEQLARIIQIFDEQGLAIQDYPPRTLFAFPPEYWEELFTGEESAWIPAWGWKQILKGYADPLARVRAMNVNMGRILADQTLNWAPPSLVEYLVVLFPHPEKQLRQIHKKWQELSSRPEFSWASDSFILGQLRASPYRAEAKLRAYKRIADRLAADPKFAWAQPWQIEAALMYRDPRAALRRQREESPTQGLAEGPDLQELAVADGVLGTEGAVFVTADDSFAGHE